MSEVQQKVPAQLDKSNGTGREMELSANEQAPCYLYSPVQKAIAQAKDQLAALHHQRATTVEGLQTLQGENLIGLLPGRVRMVSACQAYRPAKKVPESWRYRTCRSRNLSLSWYRWVACRLSG